MTFVYSPPPIVVDASAAIELLDDDAAWWDRFEKWTTDDRTLLAAPLFLAEIANALLRGRSLGADGAIAHVDRIVALGIEIADRGLVGLHEAVSLAAEHSLTVYDALYLQLALELEGELATLDTALRRAAADEGVTVID
jgi:predicted nucleic acid-binding protein